MSQPDWLLANKSRPYPLDTTASCKSDGGQLFPEDLIIDLRLMLPSDDNSPVYLSSYAATTDSINAVFSQSGKVVAACSQLAVDAQESIPAKVTSIRGEVIGRMLFGNFRPGYNYSFSSELQSGISEHALTIYPVVMRNPRFLRDVSVPLRPDQISFIGQGDLEITDELVTDDDGKQRRQISIGLRNTGEDDLLLQYAGPSNQDAESLSCGDPQPISRFGQVKPDCCGRIFLEFRGCVEMLPISDTCGVVIKCPAVLDELCPERSVPVVGELTADGEIRPDDTGSNEWEDVLSDDVIYPDQADGECDGEEIQADTDQEDR